LRDNDQEDADGSEEKVPDSGDAGAGRARRGGREKAQDDTVASLLSQYQRERAQLRAVKQINKHKGADAMPGVMPAKTYDERAAELGKLEQDVLDAFPDAVERVRKVVEQAAAPA
jgi:hypothetical protein